MADLDARDLAVEELLHGERDDVAVGDGIELRAAEVEAHLFTAQQHPGAIGCTCTPGKRRIATRGPRLHQSLAADWA